MEWERMQSDNPKLSRRKFLALTGSSAAAFILASCAAPAAPAPTAAPAAPAPPPPQPTAYIPQAGMATVVPTVAAQTKAEFGPAETKKLVWASSNPNYANQAIIQIGLDKGYFKDEGLEVEIVNTDNEKEGAIGGSVQIVHEDTGPMINSIMKDGLPMTMISPWRTSEFQGYVLRPEFKNGDDLDGKTLRTQTLGSREFIIQMQLLAANGFKTAGYGGTSRPNCIVTAGGSDPSAQMFVEGKLDGTVILPRHIELVKPVGHIVYMEKLVWPQEGQWVTKDFAAKNPNTIKRFLRAVMKGVAIYTDGSNKDYVISMMQGKGYSIPDAFVKAYEYGYVQYSTDMGYDEADMIKLEESFNFDPVPSTTFGTLEHLWAAQEAMGFKRRPAL